VTGEARLPDSGSPRVRPARRGQARLLGDVLADAFAGDPVFGWLIPPHATGRDHRMRTFFTSMSRTYLRQGKPCYLTADGSAGALWSAPGRWALPPGQIALEAVPDWLAFRGRVLRALRVQMQIEHLHARQRAPHWYLGYLGTRGGHQGQGLGSQLLREVLARADGHGVPAYLESSNERNLTLYERHGFQVVGELRALGRGPTIWRMWREPQPPAGA
jgi:ribosomal protein S18 acetylase RimI-like enzyme